MLQPGQYPTILSGKDLDASKVSVGFDQRNRPYINFGWNDEGARVFGEHTEKNIGRYLAIVLDGTVLRPGSTPASTGRGSSRGSSRWTRPRTS